MQASLLGPLSVVVVHGGSVTITEAKDKGLVSNVYKFKLITQNTSEVSYNHQQL